MKFENKIALITGGSRGLGKNSDLCLAKYGADVVIIYHSNSRSRAHHDLDPGNHR
jgi:NAD(P)-dependent dehydrogenase (short-subunit alcohol dehydrogenase family)